MYLNCMKCVDYKEYEYSLTYDIEAYKYLIMNDNYEKS